METPHTMHLDAMELWELRYVDDNIDKRRNDLLNGAYAKLRGDVTPEEREKLRDTVFILTTLWNK